MPCSTCPLLHGPSVLEDDDRTGHGRIGVSLDALLAETGEDFDGRERTGWGDEREAPPDVGVLWSDLQGFLRWMVSSGVEWRTVYVVVNRILFDDQTFAKQAHRHCKTRQAIHARLERAKQRSTAVRKLIEIAQQRRSVE